MNEASAQLCRSGKWVRAGAALVVSEPQIMVYDHRDQHVVWFREPGDETAYYLIVAETGVAELMESVNN